MTCRCCPQYVEARQRMIGTPKFASWAINHHLREHINLGGGLVMASPPRISGVRGRRFDVKRPLRSLGKSIGTGPTCANSFNDDRGTSGCRSNAAPTTRPPSTELPSSKCWTKCVLTEIPSSWITGSFRTHSAHVIALEHLRSILASRGIDAVSAGLGFPGGSVPGPTRAPVRPDALQSRHRRVGSPPSRQQARQTHPTMSQVQCT